MKTYDAYRIGRAVERLSRTLDAWEESKHPRANNGQFSHSAGGGPSPKSNPKTAGSITVESMKAARYDPSDATGRPAVLVDKWGDEWYKIGEDKWESHPSNPHTFPRIKTSQELWDRCNGKLQTREEYYKN